MFLSRRSTSPFIYIHPQHPKVKKKRKEKRSEKKKERKEKKRGTWVLFFSFPSPVVPPCVAHSFSPSPSHCPFPYRFLLPSFFYLPTPIPFDTHTPIPSFVGLPQVFSPHLFPVVVLNWYVEWYLLLLRESGFWGLCTTAPLAIVSTNLVLVCLARSFVSDLGTEPFSPLLPQISSRPGTPYPVFTNWSILPSFSSTLFPGSSLSFFFLLKRHHCLGWLLVETSSIVCLSFFLSRELARLEEKVSLKGRRCQACWTKGS